MLLYLSLTFFSACFAYLLAVTVSSDLPQSQMIKYISEIQEQQIQHPDAISRHVVYHASRWQTLHWTFWLHLLHKHTLVSFSVGCSTRGFVTACPLCWRSMST